MIENDLRTQFDAGNLEENELVLLEQIDEHVSLPDDWSVEWIDGCHISFIRDDALPVPENEQYGAAVHVQRFDFEDRGPYWVELFHEEGKSDMNYLKGNGGAWEAETFAAALRKGSEVINNADAIARGDSDD